MTACVKEQVRVAAVRARVARNTARREPLNLHAPLPQQQLTRAQKVIDEVARRHGVTYEMIVSDRKGFGPDCNQHEIGIVRRDAVLALCLAFPLNIIPGDRGRTRQKHGIGSLKWIGRQMRRDHTTIVHHVRALRKEGRL